MHIFHLDIRIVSIIYLADFRNTELDSVTNEIINFL